MEGKKGDLTDRAGSVASSLCALHCALCAVAPGLLGLVGAGFLLSHRVEWLLVLVAILLGIGALVLAWRSHRSKRVMAYLSCGMLGLLVARGIEMSSGHHEHEGSSSNATEAVFEAETHGEHAANPTEHSGAEVLASAHAEEHHGEEHHGEEHHGEEHHGEEDEGLVHYAGAGVGVIGGLLLLFGHLLNIRTSRQFRDDCCD